MKNNVIQIHPDDTVAVAVAEIKKGEPLKGAGRAGMVAVTDIPRHHKVALHDMEEDSPVIKYGKKIALAKAFIRAGEWVHTHNIKE